MTKLEFGHLETEWHPTKNLPLMFNLSLIGARKYWWLGVCGHEWEANLRHRANGSGCPYCSNKRVLTGFNDLVTVNPSLANQWHPTKNLELTADVVISGSGSKVWWLGECGHEWDAVVIARANGSGCPVCAGQKVLAGFNDLATKNPEVASQWHPSKNGDKTPQQITVRSSRSKVWWLGLCGHEWEALVSDRTGGSGCPICSGHQLLVGFNDLATISPILAAQWHPTKNGGLTPHKIIAGGNKKVWWVGVCNHEWQSVLSARISGAGCPICAGHQVLIGFNDVATVNLTIALQWHPTKNQLTAQQVVAGSHKKYWWLGLCGHEWEANPSNRIRRNSGCPYCSGAKVLAGFNDLATTHPEIASEWHPTKNGEQTPDEVGRGSNKRFWWKCSEGHEWETTVNDRTTGGRCHVCSGHWILIGFNDLATTHPQIAAQWHPTKNKLLPSEIVGRGSVEKYWWQCNEKHEWDANLTSRINGHGCPYCSGNRVIAGKTDAFTRYPNLRNELHPTKNKEKFNLSLESSSSTRKLWWLGVCGHEWETTINNRTSGSGCHFCSGKNIYGGINDLATINSVVASEWHPTKNGELTAQQITAANPKKAWWLGLCGHEWEARVADRNDGSRCPFCSGSKVLSGFNDLATKNPILAAQWHPTKNETLTAGNVTLRTDKKVWWLGLCGHEWVARVADRTGGPSSGGQGCPFCSGSKVLSGFNDLATKNPILAAEWHPTKNGELTPQQFTAGSNKRVWWFGTCGHEWENTIGIRNSGNNCPICSNNLLLLGYNDLTTKNRSLAAEWHPTKNGELKPEQIMFGSKKRVWWLCGKGHEWEVSPAARRGGSGCPRCVNQVSGPEEKIQEFLFSLGIKAETSVWSVLKPKRLQLDLWIPEKKIAIEFNGTHWHKEKFRGNESHYEKWLACKIKDIQLIQIWEDDWNLRPEIIMRTLAHKLGVSISTQVIGDTEAISITEHQAEEFLTQNHLQGFMSGLYYLGLVETGDTEKMQAVMVLDTELKSGKSLEIIRYANINSSTDAFSELLAPAINAYRPKSITVVADHCMSDKELYEDSGFSAEQVLPPDYMYVVRNERKDKSEYPLERFRDDPKLLWEEGLTEMELADLNGLDRIWDAGKTRYRLYC